MADTRKCGIITDITGLSAGIMVNSLDYAENVETAEAKNEKGQTVSIVAFSNSKTVSLTGIMDEAKGTVAKAGSIITIDGKDWLIESVSRKETNTAHVSLSISAKTADNAVITALAESTNS